MIFGPDLLLLIGFVFGFIFGVIKTRRLIPSFLYGLIGAILLPLSILILSIIIGIIIFILAFIIIIVILSALFGGKIV